MNPIAAFKATSGTIKALVLLAAVVILGTGLIVGWHVWTASRAASTKSTVATGQLGAQSASGKDAVATAGNQADAETAADDLTRNNADAIEQANGAQTIVPADAQDAGIRALCQRPAYAALPACAKYR